MSQRINDGKEAEPHLGVFCKDFLTFKGGHANFLLVRKKKNSHILGLIPQLQIRKFLRCASPQIANPQICKEKKTAFLII
jgi:hypothetical protein